MATNVVQAPQTSEIPAWLRISVAIGLVALVLVGAALVLSSYDSPTVSGADVRAAGRPDEATVAVSVSAGRAVFPAHPDEARIADAVSRETPEPNLLPK